MELKFYLQIIKKNLALIASLALIGAFSAYFSTSFLESGYKATGTFYLSNNSSNEDQQRYNFDGYFSQSTAINATDTTVAILTSSDFQKEFSGSQASVGVRKIAPQVIEITTTSQDQQLSKK